MSRRQKEDVMEPIREAMGRERLQDLIGQADAERRAGGRRQGTRRPARRTSEER
jgi:hypothetical protein